MNSLRSYRRSIEKKKTQTWVILLTSSLAAILLYYSLRGLDWVIFWHSLRIGQYHYLFATLPMAAFSYFLRALRWRILLEDEKKLSALTVFWANMIGYLGNLYLPARAGELVRSAILGKESGKGMSFVLATALTERVIDTVALVVILSAALLRQNDLPPIILNAIWGVGIGGVIGLLAVFILPHQEKLLRNLIYHIPVTKTSQDRINEQSNRFMTGMRSLQDINRITKFLAFTLIIWWIDGASLVIGAHILSRNLSLPQALTLLAALGLSSAIPSTPGYVGVYQFVAVSVLVPFGFSHADSLAYIIIIQISGYILVTLFGLVGLWRARRGGSLPSLFQIDKRT